MCQTYRCGEIEVVHMLGLGPVTHVQEEGEVILHPKNHHRYDQLNLHNPFYPSCQEFHAHDDGASLVLVACLSREL